MAFSVASSSAARILLLIFANFHLIYSHNYAPVLIWDSSKENSLPVVSAADHLSETEFQIQLKELFSSSKSTFVFLQDSLSSEDFTIYGSRWEVFPNLAKILSTYSSTYLPFVDSPQKIPSLLSQNRNVIEANDSFSEIIGDVKGEVIVFRLPATEGVVDRRVALRKIDQIIGNVMNKIEVLYPSFTVLYTAAKSDWATSLNDLEPTEADVRHARHILALTDNLSDKGSFWGIEGCFLMFSKNLTFRVSNPSPADPKILNYTSETISLDEFSTDTSQSLCSSNNSAMIVLQYKAPLKEAWLQSLQLTLNFNQTRTNDWELSTLFATYKTLDNLQDVVTELRIKDVWAPASFSWNCASPTFSAKNTTFPRVDLRFDKLQFQVFGVNQTFGDSFDCVGFFTAGIWMSIFTTFILIMILGFGITMLMSINTNDRFDDPKGKTITVTASD